MTGNQFINIISVLIVLSLLSTIMFLTVWLFLRFGAKKKSRIAGYGVLISLGVAILIVSSGFLTSSYQDTTIWRWQAKHIDKVTKDQHIIVKAMKNPTDHSTYDGYEAAKDLVKETKTLPHKYETDGALEAANKIKTEMKLSRGNHYATLDDWAASEVTFSNVLYFSTIDNGFVKTYTKRSNVNSKPVSQVLHYMIENTSYKDLGKAIKNATNLQASLDDDDDDDYDLDY